MNDTSNGFVNGTTTSSSSTAVNINNNNNNINNNNNNNRINDCNMVVNQAIGEQPDPDYIKMFVGQIPRSMDEDQLRVMFEEYGRVHQINVLRDKTNGQSKGK